MTKKEIARWVYEKSQLSLADSQDAVQATLEAISKALIKHGRVELRGFGVFSVQKRAARKAFNPRTGEEVFVEEHNTVVFKPSKLMKTGLQESVAKAPASKKKNEAKSKATKSASSAKSKKAAKRADEKE